MLYNPLVHEPWLFCPDLRTGPLVIDDTEARHALGSLRLRAGDALTLFDGRGHIARAALAIHESPTAAARAHQSKRRQGAAVVVESISDVPAQDRTLTLLVAACKGPRLDWLIEKCTELGVTRIVLTEFARSVVHTGPQHTEKLRRTAIEACKQCGRAWLPLIETGVTLANARDAAGALADLPRTRIF